MKKYFLRIILCIVFVFICSCEEESTCETKKQCYSDANGGETCIDVPVPGTCIETNFGF